MLMHKTQTIRIEVNTAVTSVLILTPWWMELTILLPSKLAVVVKILSDETCSVELTTRSLELKEERIRLDKVGKVP